MNLNQSKRQKLSPHLKQKFEIQVLALHYTLSLDAMRETAIIFHISEPPFISRSWSMYLFTD